MPDTKLNIRTVGIQKQVDATQKEVRMEPWRGSMKKRTIFSAFSLIFVFSLAHAASMSPRAVNIDRGGGDFTNFVLPIPDPLLCENSCGGEPRCSFWNYDTVSPGGTAERPQCFLKDNSAVKTGVHNGTISGAKIH